MKEKNYHNVYRTKQISYKFIVITNKFFMLNYIQILIDKKDIKAKQYFVAFGEVIFAKQFQEFIELSSLRFYSN